MRPIQKIAAVMLCAALALSGCSDESAVSTSAETSTAAETSTVGGSGVAETTAPAAGSADGALATPLTVVAAFGPLADAATRVGGSRVKVINLTKTGVEPHDLEIATDQLDAIQDAALVVYLGDSFQAAIEDAVKTRKGTSLDVLTKVDPLDTTEAGHEEEGQEEAGHEEEGVHDPHFWLDPMRMSSAAEAIGEALSSVDAAGAKEYAANAQTYRGEMTSLDAEFSAGLATCKSKTFVTAHAAFGYLANRYGLTQVSVAGISPEVEPNPARLAEVSDLVKAQGVTTIFAEELVSPKVAEAIARETGAKTGVLSPIEGFTDADIASGASYATKMRENLTALREALSCT